MDAEAGCRRSANGMIYGATSEFTQVTPRLFVPIVIVIALSCCSSKRRRSATRYHFMRAEGFHAAEPSFCGDGGMAGTMRAGFGFFRKQNIGDLHRRCVPAAWWRRRAPSCSLSHELEIDAGCSVCPRGAGTELEDGRQGVCKEIQP